MTVDPERDTPEVLARYVPAFDARFLGLYGRCRGDRPHRQGIQDDLPEAAGQDAGTYSVDHSAGTYVFDREGRVRLFVRHDQAVEDLVHDIRIAAFQLESVDGLRHRRLQAAQRLLLDLTDALGRHAEFGGKLVQGCRVGFL